MRRPRGVTLMEALLVLLLLSLLLGMAASLMQGTVTTMRSASERGDARLAAQVELERIASEAREAIDVLQPPPGDEAQELHFVKLDPSGDPGRLPTPVPEPPPLAWNPYPETLDVGYALTPAPGQEREQLLTRTVTPSGGSAAVQVVARGIRRFSARCLPSGNLQLELEVPTAGGPVHRLRTEVLLPVP